MKILHVADLHGHLPWYDWLAREARRFDLVVVAGDLIDLGVHAKLHPREQAQAISTVLRGFPVPLALCSGNHDQMPGNRDGWGLGENWLHGLRRPGRWIDGDRFTLGDVHFRCLPWGRPLLEAKEEREVWIVHAPANQTAPACSTTDLTDWGDFELGEVCRARRGPWLALCGHVHSPRAWHGRAGPTLVLNPGRGSGQDNPNRIEIDVALGSATWRPSGGEASSPVSLG